MKEQNLQSVYLHEHSGDPIAIRMKAETKEREGSTFIVELSL